MANVSVVGLLGRMVVSLGMVIGVMYAVAKVARRRVGLGGSAGRRNQPLQVLARQPVGKGASLTAVRSGDRILLLGVTEQNISLLAETDLPAEEPQPADAPADARQPLGQLTWPALLDRARDLTVRRV